MTSTLLDTQRTGTAPTSAPGDRVAPPAPKKSLDIIGIVGPIGVFFLFLAAWYGGRLLLATNKRFVLPPPHEIITEGYGNGRIRTAIVKATLLDIEVAAVGLAIAIVLGMSIAIVMGQARWLERSFYPYFVALQAIPILTLTPLIGSVMGYGKAPRIFVTVIITIFPIIANTLFGLRGVEAGFHDLFTLHGVNRLSRLVKLQLPAASPSIFTGFRISAGLAVIGAIVGDAFFRAGKAGLGLQVDKYASRLNGPGAWGCIIAAAALGLAFFGFFSWLKGRVVDVWNETSR
jgi:NitT/TauT family transport system permease protein